jgi:hypothetical protein
MKDQQDWCKDCYREMQMEEAERQEYSEADSEESDTPDGLYEEQALKTKVKCNSCIKNIVFSREERYLESHGSSGFSCEICRRDFNCKRGYFRCPDHYVDYCKDCFCEKQAEVEHENSMMVSSMSKALQEETFTIACRVEKCGKPLEYAEKDRYMDSDNKTTFDC